MSSTPQPARPIPQVEARQYNTHPGSGYTLPADQPEGKRLNLQHEVILGALGGRMIVPAVNIGPEDHVLDSGTGTGAWLLDLASKVPPSVLLVGTDISFNLFPADHPPNATFETRSVLDLPEHWTSRFTFAHQRLLVLALRASEWPVAISELYRVLKPGGWLQTGEYSTVLAPSGPLSSGFQRILHAMARDRGLDWQCAENLASRMAQAGFVDVFEDRIKIPLGRRRDEDAARHQESHIGAFKGMKTPILRAGGYGVVFSEQEYDEMMRGHEEEWDENPDAYATFVVCCGRKPEVHTLGE